VPKESKDFSKELREKIAYGDKTHCQNLDALKSYFGVSERPPFDGSYFEFYEFDSDNANVIVASDLVAVTFLSMEIKRESKSGISTANAISLQKNSQKIAEILSEIPTDRELHLLSEAEYSRLVGKDSLGTKLWDLLRDRENGIGMHRVATYKLIARKRPHLYPIKDSRTAKILGNQNDWWKSWYETLIENPEIVAELERLRGELSEDVPIAKGISLLRIADIALWQKKT
jgi:hypothetical protein